MLSDRTGEVAVTVSTRSVMCENTDQ